MFVCVCVFSLFVVRYLTDPAHRGYLERAVRGPVWARAVSGDAGPVGGSERLLWWYI